MLKTVPLSVECEWSLWYIISIVSMLEVFHKKKLRKNAVLAFTISPQSTNGMRPTV